MKQIVVPELKRYYKKLQDNKATLERECKLSGVPVYKHEKPESMIERLVGV